MALRGWLQLREASLDDSAFLLRLRNMEDSVRWSQSGKSVRKKEHERWMRQVVSSRSSRVFIGILAFPGGPPSEAIGMVRLESAGEGEWRISIALDEPFRGKGLSRPLLSQALVQLRTELTAPSIALVAHVHRENLASQALFRSLGFLETVDEREFLTFNREMGRDSLRGFS